MGLPQLCERPTYFVPHVVDDDAPPSVEWDAGAEAGYSGFAPSGDSLEYARGFEYGRACLNRRLQIRSGVAW
jgi:hypothetical protein